MQTETIETAKVGREADCWCAGAELCHPSKLQWAVWWCSPNQRTMAFALNLDVVAVVAEVAVLADVAAVAAAVVSEEPAPARTNP